MDGQNLMLCAFPQRVSPKTTRPCGQCIPCKVNFQRKWLCRLILESKMSVSTQFLTLTYDEEHQPTCRDPENGATLGTLRKSDVQDYIKALRRKLSRIPLSSTTTPLQVRYYAVGEYGARSGRPHYHLILFGLDETKYETITSTWRDGFSSIRPADSTAMAYTLKYTLKNLKDPSDPSLRGRAPVFALMSKRPPIGTTFLPKVAESIKKVAFDSKGNLLTSMPTTIRIDGSQYPLDRTLRLSLLRHLRIDGDPRRSTDAYPTQFSLGTDPHAQKKATDFHKKAWINRNKETGNAI